MSVRFQINVPRDVAGGFDRVEDLLAHVNILLGREAQNQLRKHFRERNLSGPRNALGAASSNFWADVMESVGEAEVSATGVKVPITHAAIRQKVHGGTIRKDDKKLAIPARAEAYNRSPRLFDNLKVMVFGRVAALVEDNEEDKPSVFYWLVDSVTQSPDPRALPDKAVMVAALKRRLQRVLNRNPQNS